MSDEYARAGVDEYDVQGTPPGDLGYPDRCPTCGGTKEERRRRYDETKWWQATPLPACTDTFHDREDR